MFTKIVAILALTGLALSIPLDSNDVIKPTEYNVTMNAIAPLPRWLTEFTGLTAWPGPDPPYIPLNFIDFSKVPNYPRRKWTNAHQREIAARLIATSVSTFDDGPSAFTPNLLNNLNHKVTFFTLGMNVVRYPEVYRRAAREGHLMASHTWSHPFLPSLTNEKIVAQFEWSIWAMNATGHHLPKWYRPPYGAIDDRVRAIARMFGMQAVVWDHDLFDWGMETKPPIRTRQKVISDAHKFKAENKGGLVLEHDAYESTVNAAIEVSSIFGPDQLTVAQCVDGINYIKEY
ncbi:hypothetical protein BRETT_001943 [Brettanomyces bruxellensis]|uniref:chitin deacetylase n=1 Tax=Dekkera bruxellensis TaxID=5007 RepID=A0A871R7D4_DEKBR|nr:uncharacterized protein BRETT_001943 [Brettanomyces bruxellensis]QOU21779.1 hypothetical protein BRETT_001943 [Brettanomyces bruxellensis]